MPFLAAEAVLLLLAWGYARSTIYTLTSARLAIRSGLAVPVTTTIAFELVEGAALKRHGKDLGDLCFTVRESERPSWAMLWPSVRPWRWRHPEPSFRLRSPWGSGGLEGESGPREERPGQNTRLRNHGCRLRFGCTHRDGEPMSALHAHQQVIPRPVAWMAGMLVTLSLLGAGVARYTGYNATSLPDTPLLGEEAVVLHVSSQDHLQVRGLEGLLMDFGPGEGGFLRGVHRALGRTRLQAGVDIAAPTSFSAGGWARFPPRSANGIAHRNDGLRRGQRSPYNVRSAGGSEGVWPGSEKGVGK